MRGGILGGYRPAIIFNEDGQFAVFFSTIVAFSAAIILL